MEEKNRHGATRREVLRGGGKLALAFPLAGMALVACGEDERQFKRSEPYTPEDWEPSGQATAGQDTGPVTVATDAPDPAPETETPETETPEPPPAASAAGGDGQLVTEIAGAAPMVAALQYTNTSTTAGQECDGCQLYTAGAGGVGKCQLFAEGVVKATGWCASWAPRA